MNLRIFLILLFCICSTSAWAEVSSQDKVCLKKWGVAYCLSTFSHTKDLAPIAAEAAEDYYEQCLSNKSGKIEVNFILNFKYIRDYYNKKASDFTSCKNGENCSFMKCLNVTESINFTTYLNSLQ